MISAVVILVAFIAGVHARSTGAPDEACAAIAPQHGVASQPIANSPFSLNVTQLTAAGGYVPGQVYSLVLTGGSQQYRGLLVQARRGSTPVGNFIVDAGSLVQSACSNTAVTHTSSVLKNNVQLMWNAPAKGTGAISFSYAVVVQNSGGMNTFYATLTSSTIAELAVPQVSITAGTTSVSVPSSTPAATPAGTTSVSVPSSTPVATPAGTTSVSVPSSTPAATPADVEGLAWTSAESSLVSLIVTVMFGMLAVYGARAL